MNLTNLDFLQQFGKLMRLIGADNDVKVVVIESALPDYFMAHSDLNFMAGSIKAGAWTPEANSLHQMFEAIKGESQGVYCPDRRAGARRRQRVCYGHGHVVCRSWQSVTVVTRSRSRPAAWWR